MLSSSQTDEKHLKNNNDEISLAELILKVKEWCRYLLLKKNILISVGLLGGILGFTYANFKKNRYLAKTTFVLESTDSKSGLSQYAGLASMAGIDFGNNGNSGIFVGNNIFELYKSFKMISETLLTRVPSKGDKLLIDDYIEINDFKQKWIKSGKDLASLDFKSNINNLRIRDSLLILFVDDIRNNYLKIGKVDEELSIIKVEIESTDESFSKNFNEALVHHVNEFYSSTKTKKSSNNINLLQRKVDSVRAIMNGAIYTAVAVSDATPNLNVTRQTQRIVPAQKAQFSVETNKAILVELVKNLELSKMNMLKETPLIQTIDTPVLPLKISRLGKLRAVVVGILIFIILSSLALLVRKFFKSHILN